MQHGGWNLLEDDKVITSLSASIVQHGGWDLAEDKGHYIIECQHNVT